MSVQARKRFGQHFLEPAWIEKVVDAIEPDPADVFLEIGPGRGALTIPLARRVGRLVGIEVDRDLAANLRAIAPDNVEVIDADVLTMDLVNVVRERAPGTRVRVAGNLPYNISSPILFQLLASQRSADVFTDATLLLQAEVVDRIVATPGSGDYGVLSILTQLRAHTTRLLRVPPGAFRPAPSVSSALVQLRFRAPSVHLDDEAIFERMVRTVFQQRRKTLANALRSFAQTTALSAEEALRIAGIDRRRRPETLTLDELGLLADAFSRRRA
jgi:16S rRNA (adenine1518-N6/adenine1519-N6)-dimethyltransferase